ncbi:MAG: hypothetical protein GXP29_04340 [Planctomycetes bacterium]|nr:hypothetical protein [Planctomycetota bacterium]
MVSKLVILGVSLIAISGCAMNGPYIPPVAMIHETALFDPFPNPRFADLGNVRSDWPSSDAYFANPEHLEYEERIYDIQGYNNNNNSYPIRRFQLRRTGSGVR